MTLLGDFSHRNMRGVSVVVCSRDRPQHLAACLEALLTAIRPQDEVIVVDSASRDARTRRAAFDHGVRVVRCERPGLSHARNAGLADLHEAHHRLHRRRLPSATRLDCSAGGRVHGS